MPSIQLYFKLQVGRPGDKGANQPILKRFMKISSDPGICSKSMRSTLAACVSITIVRIRGDVSQSHVSGWLELGPTKRVGIYRSIPGLIATLAWLVGT